MKCPNCGKNVSSGYICPYCQADIFIFQKMKNASIRFYNEGLQAANEQNLSKAITVLEQSILFDKNNIDARNLLGLVYLEVGHIADALKHWIISTSLQPENNFATEYINTLQKNSRLMEKYNDAIKYYNQALHYLKQNSDDVAIIRLKKALDLNPNFIDACNLMTFCCLTEENEKRALHFIETVLQKDANNPLALHYLQQIQQSDHRTPFSLKKRTVSHEKLPNVVSVKKTDSPPPLPRYKRGEKKNAHLLAQRDFISFGVGILTATLVIFTLILPSFYEQQKQTIDTLQAQVESFQGSTNMTPEEVASMREQFNTLQTENKQLRSEETKQANLELLETAIAQANEQKFEECVVALESINTFGFSEEDMQKYDDLKAKVAPKAAEIFYNKGKNEFMSSRFAEAKTNLEYCMKFLSTEDFADDVYFYLGKIAEQEKNLDAAKAYYEKIQKQFPNSNQIENVTLALEKMQS